MHNRTKIRVRLDPLTQPWPQPIDIARLIDAAALGLGALYRECRECHKIGTWVFRGRVMSLCEKCSLKQLYKLLYSDSEDDNAD